MYVVEWLGGLHIGIPMLGAPVATYFYYQKGTRVTVILGILGVSMCFALAALVSNPGESQCVICPGCLGLKSR